jgi:hypothetical protein
MQASMRTVVIVVSGEGTKDLGEVPLACDQQPVEALGARSLHPAFRHRVGFGRADRGAVL